MCKNNYIHSFKVSTVNIFLTRNSQIKNLTKEILLIRLIENIFSGFKARILIDNCLDRY